MLGLYVFINNSWEFVRDVDSSEPTPEPEFIYKSTKPSNKNTGVSPNVTLGDFDGSSLNLTSANTTYDGARFSGLPGLAAPNLTFNDCLFQGVPGQLGMPNSGGSVKASNANVKNAVFNRCTFRPATGSNASIGLVGHDFTLDRCDISGVVDGVRIYNGADPNGPSGVEMHGTYIHDLSYYTPFSGHSDNQTHNDGVQIEGGTGTLLSGCYISARADAHPNFGAGPTATQLPPYVLSALIITPNVGEVHNTRAEYNWFDGGYAPINLSEKGRGAYNFELVGNRFSGQKGLTQDFLLTQAIRTASNGAVNWVGNIREDTGDDIVLGFGPS